MNPAPDDSVPMSAPVRVPAELAEAVAESLDRREQLGWVLWAWGVVAQAGDGEADLSEWTDVQSVVGLAALAKSLATYSGILADTPGTDWRTPDLLGSSDPWVSDVALGRYSERHDIHTGELPESPADLLELAIAEREPQVRAALRRLLGGASLYASMLGAVQPADVVLTDEAEPCEQDAAKIDRWVEVDGLMANQWRPNLSPDAASSAVNTQLEPQHHAAFEWLLHG